MKRIRWKNIILLLILLVTISLILKDIYTITLYSWITGNMHSFTWLGVLTFSIEIVIGGGLIDYFIEQYNQ